MAKKRSAKSKTVVKAKPKSNTMIYAVIAIVIVAVAIVGIALALMFTGGNFNSGGSSGSGKYVPKITGLTDQSGHMITSGGTTTERVQKITGTFEYSNPDGSVPSTDELKAVMQFNGDDQFMQIYNDGAHDDGGADDSTFAYEGEMVLKPGQNTFKTIIINNENDILGQSSEMKITANIPTMDIKVVLVWDTNYNDVDLHIWDPNNDHCYWRELTGIPGAQLDIDDQDGYGPETFTMLDAVSGKYTVAVRYYDAHGQTEPVHATVKVTLHEGSTQTYTHTFYPSEANYDDDSNDWFVAEFNA